MRKGFEGKIKPAIAQHVDISADLKTYTFTLRDSMWNNGDPVTAGDFERSWKSVLHTNFNAPNAYQLYPIKGAQAFKKGEVSAEHVGVKAVDAKTLVVELEKPTPYFLELTTTHFYYPVHASQNAQQKSDQIISNGLFNLSEWKKNNELSFLKNKHYWDAKLVNLESIKVVVLDENTALHLFENKELDWAGSPMSDIPQDAIQTLRHQEHLHMSPAAGTHWFHFNIANEPFDNANMRKAFALAIDRKAIVENITQGSQKPATGIVPPVLGLLKNHYFEDNAVTEAWDHFQKALVEMGSDIDHFSEVTLCYKAGDRSRKIAEAVQQQWEKAFEVRVLLESCENKSFYDKLTNHQFQIAAGSWFADFADPINFLEIFKDKNNPTNNTRWENERFAELLNQSAMTNSSRERSTLLTEAEGVLMQEMPVAPLFYSMFNYVKNGALYGVYFSELGYLDFKHAYYE